MEAYPDVLAAVHAVEERIADYLDDYQVDDGDGGVYTPTEAERDMIDDAIKGLLADEAFTDAIAKWRNLVAGYRRGSGGA